MSVIIIAEAGVNHNGDVELAKKLIEVAADACVDYVKFQTFKASNIVSQSAQKADYQIENIKEADASQFKMLKKLELSEAEHEILIDYCREKRINFLSTGFDLESIDYLSNKIDFIKIPSGEITNALYIKNCAEKNLPIVLSTGMSTLSEVNSSLNILLANGVNKSDITILHCNTEYPTPMCDVNLLAMNTMAKEFGVNVGYSDHTLGIEVPIAAVALGATVIEKHFTLDRNMEGPDHKASLEPSELKAMVKAIRNIELALGDGEKVPSESEKKNIPIARKSIHLAKDVMKGSILSNDSITMKRPGDGISPMEYEKVLGKKIVKDIKMDSQLAWEDLE